MKSSHQHLFGQELSRRQLLQGLLAVPAGAVLFASCGRESATSGRAESTAGTATTNPASTAAKAAAAGGATTASAGTAATGSTVTATASGWASGGTELITVAYPDDSIFATANTCTVALTPATTEGPCYFQTDTGEDITLGKTGLPMQLCLQLVDTECQPLEGYTIEVWSCDTRGIYSGDTSASADATSFAGDFCTAGDAEAESSTYLRGQLTTDASGRVNFATIFPGWYSGRTIHIHFAVSDPDGTARVISQYCFSDEFAAEICTTHDQYADRGEQDTPLSSGDTVFPADGWEAYQLTTQQNPDGTLLGFSVIQLDPTAVAQDTSSGGASGAGDDAPPGDGTPPDGPPPSDA